MTEREELNERYLEAQLRGELGIDPDLSESVLRRVYGKPRRVIPGPRRAPRWRPLAAAAVVLIAAGAATYALVKVLPDQLQPGTQQAEQPPARRQAQPVPRPSLPKPVDTKDLLPDPSKPLQDPELPQETERVPVKEPAPVVPSLPDPVEKPKDAVDGKWPRGLTDPPDAWPDKPGRPDPAKPVAPDPTNPAKRAVLATGWRGDGMTITRDGRSWKWKESDWGELLDGDRVTTRGAIDFTLAAGGLLRLDGELTFGLRGEAASLQLHDGALYADTTAEILVATTEVEAAVSGVVVLEERLHRMDVFCISGSVKSGAAQLSGGFHARLEKDGFGREKAITWEDAQREFKFLKETPSRVVLVEELNEAPGELFGGRLKDGVLVGDVDSDSGIGFYLREPYEFREGDVVRFRFRVAKACEMILQFGTVADDNWRHKMGGVKAGEWIEYDLPLADLYKTTDVARKAAPGLKLKFFQLHPEDGKASIELDRVEIVHRP